MCVCVSTLNFDRIICTRGGWAFEIALACYLCKLVWFSDLRLIIGTISLGLNVQRNFWINERIPSHWWHHLSWIISQDYVKQINKQTNKHPSHTRTRTHSARFQAKRNKHCYYELINTSDNDKHEFIYFISPIFGLGVTIFRWKILSFLLTLNLQIEIIWAMQ